MGNPKEQLLFDPMLGCSGVVSSRAARYLTVTWEMGILDMYSISFTKSACVLGVCAILSACGTSSEFTTDSDFASLNGGVIAANLDFEQNGSVSNPAVGLVAFASGSQGEGNVVALAGIRPGATVGTAVTSGRFTYNTRYGYSVGDDIKVDGDTIVGGRSTGVSPDLLVLTANFDAGRVRGSNAEIDVDARVNGTNLDGDVTVDLTVRGGTGSIDAVLDGSIGSTGVIGAFHGHDDNTVIAGGLVGTRNP